MVSVHKTILSACLAVLCLTGHAATVVLTPGVGTQSSWGNLDVGIAAGFQGTKTFDFHWNWTPAVGDVFLGAHALANDADDVVFSNLLVWRCGATCDETTSVAPGATYTARQSFASLVNGYTGRNSFYMDLVTLPQGHYLFSLDVRNDTPSPATMTAKVGVFAPTDVSPVPEPGTWGLMLAGLAVVGIRSVWLRRSRWRQAPTHPGRVEA